MDKDTHPGHEPEHVDLTQIEDKPGTRADPLFERQTDDTEIMAPWFGTRFYSDTPVRSPARTATALLKVALAASLPAAGLATAGWALRIAGWLTLTLATLTFLIVGTVGLLLILRTKPTPRTPRETNSDDSEEDDDGTNPQTHCGQTHQRHSRHACHLPRRRNHRSATRHFDLKNPGLPTAQLRTLAWPKPRPTQLMSTTACSAI
jgi:hypothetical protein